MVAVMYPIMAVGNDGDYVVAKHSAVAAIRLQATESSPDVGKFSKFPPAFFDPVTTPTAHDSWFLHVNHVRSGIMPKTGLLFNTC
jgi:hypothetical protein